MSTTKRRLLAAAATALVALSAMAAHADYPDRAITITVGFAPGGTADLLCRILADATVGEVGQKVIVENKTGASGFIGRHLLSALAAAGAAVSTLQHDSSVEAARGEVHRGVLRDAASIERAVRSSAPVLTLSWPRENDPGASRLLHGERGRGAGGGRAGPGL